MENLTDQELALAARAGEAVAFDILVRRHAAPVYRFVFRLVKDGPTAEDITQETFLKVWKNLKRFNPEKSFKAWIYRIARNTAFDWLKKKRAFPFTELEGEDGETAEVGEMADEAPLPDELVLSQELRVELAAALDRLAPRARSVVLLHEIDDLTFQEIADVSDEPLNTVKSRYRRALVELRKIILKPES